MNHSLKWLIALAFFSVAVAFGANPTGKYKVIVDELNALEAQYPEFASVFSIGSNDDDVQLYGLRISASPKVMNPDKIGHFMVGTHHGNETKAPVFVMNFIERLLSRYSSEEFWRGNLSDIEWTIIPVLNVSGYNKTSRYEHGVDPNRDYPGPCNDYPGGKLKSVRTLMDFLAQRTFSGSVTVHGYVGSLTYPWGVATDEVETQDHNYFAEITRKAAEENGYLHGTSTDVVYPAPNTYEDWAYWKYGMWSLLIELESGSASDIERTVNAMEVYYDQLVASPSNQNAFLGNCNRDVPDLRIE